jgi:AbrB family looped-hinge helix DNA binding protein
MPADLTLTAKGQLTLRQEVRDHLGVRPGQKLSVELLPDGRVALKPAERKADISGLAGLLHRPGQRALSLDEMQEAIELAAVERALGPR